MKALVTGACGFVGSHLVEHLLDEGYDVRASIFYNSFNSWGGLEAIPKSKMKNVEVIAGDIRDPNGVRNAVEGVDVVFHLAALIAIPFSYYSPDSYVDTNIKGTLNVLQAARSCKTKKIVITSTSEVYGTARYVPIDENHPLQGQSPYSATKIAAEKMSEAFYRSFGVPIVIVRPFNTYGPRQSARAVIPTIISQAFSDSKEVKLGNLTPTRDLNYVADVCSGYIQIAKSDKTIGKTINICSGREISIGDLADLILKIAGTGKKIARDTQRLRPGKSEVERLLGDNRLIRSLTGWKPQHTLEKGLEKTIEWFNRKENLKNYKANIYNL